MEHWCEAVDIEELVLKINVVDVDGAHCDDLKWHHVHIFLARLSREQRKMKDK